MLCETGSESIDKFTDSSVGECCVKPPAGRIWGNKEPVVIGAHKACSLIGAFSLCLSFFVFLCLSELQLSRRVCKWGRGSPDMAASDLVCVSLQFVEHSSAAAMYNDLDFAYQLQLDEALAASEGLDYESWSASKDSSSREPFAHDVSIAHQMQSRELERRQQELVDKEAADVETRSVTQNLQQRAHDLEFARSIAETPEEEWEEVGDTLEQPFEAEGDLSATDCGQEFEMDIQGVKTDGGQLGVGCILMDPAGSVVWQQSKYLGQGLSWHAGEYTGLLEGMAMAEKLGLKRLWVHASSRVVVNQVRNCTAFPISLAIFSGLTQYIGI